MRISRRASRTTAAVPHAAGTPGASALRRTTAAGTALALAALTTAACSSSSSGGSGAPSTSSVEQAGANANENDIQILNSLQLTTRELDTAFAADNQWRAWPDADMGKLVIKQAQGCTGGIIDTKAQALQPVTSVFRADALPGDQVSTPASGSSSPSSSNKSSSSSKNHTPSAPGTTSGSTTAGVAADGNPTHWVVTTAIAYQSSDAARAAVSHMGKIDSTQTSECGGPTDTTRPLIGGGIGEVGPSWDNSQGVFVYADTKSGTSVAVVAQRRGRYVVLTYTRGGGKQQAGYYDLEGGPDTPKAADAATGVLGQLTNAVVNRG